MDIKLKMDLDYGFELASEEEYINYENKMKKCKIGLHVWAILYPVYDYYHFDFKIEKIKFIYGYIYSTNNYYSDNPRIDIISHHINNINPLFTNNNKYSDIIFINDIMDNIIKFKENIKILKKILL